MSPLPQAATGPQFSGNLFSRHPPEQQRSYPFSSSFTYAVFICMAPLRSLSSLILPLRQPLPYAFHYQ